MAWRPLALVLVPLALAGCGGGHEPKPRPTKAQFAAAAAAVCAKSTTRAGRVARLSTLRPPVGGEELYARWMKAEQDALKAVMPSDDPPDPDATDPAIVLAIADGKIAGYARRLGIDACARP